MRHSISRALGLAAVLLSMQALSASAFAANGSQGASGGATNVNGGDGFGCANGTTYQMVNGVARCALPAAATSGSASCAASVLTQGACSFSFPFTTSGSSPSISTSTPGYAGAAQATCSNGTWGSMAATCGPNPCTALSASFNACSFNLPATASGTSPSVSTTTPGFTGVGQATCNAGVWSPLTASCVPNGCAATSSAYGSCTFAVPTLSSGQVLSLSNTAAGFTGSETASCAGGTLSFSSQSCAPVAATPCSSAMLSWGGGCNASAGSTASGGGVNLTNIASGFTGAASAVCTNGNWSSPVGSCTPVAPAPCAPGAISWGPGNACSASISATSSGASASVTNVATGYTGSATFSCTNSAWTGPSSANCVANCGSGTMAWGVGCSSPITGVASGSSRSLINVATGYTGNATFACSNGSWGTPTNVSCSSSAPLPATCPANIWVTSKNQKLPLTVANPADTLPNGHSYCLYSTTLDDRYAGVFDRVTGQAVDFFPIFTEIPDATGDTTRSRFVFQKYEARYSGNLHIQGAYCANNPADPTQKGFYPGTCRANGSGNFAPMCFVEMSPSSTLGSFMQAHGLGLRLADGGSKTWGAYVWAPQFVDDGTNTWSESALWSAAYGYYQGGLPNRCLVSQPMNERPIPSLDNPAPPQN